MFSGTPFIKRSISDNGINVPVGLFGFATKINFVFAVQQSINASTFVTRSFSSATIGVAPTPKAQIRYIPKPCSVNKTSSPTLAKA